MKLAAMTGVATGLAFAGVASAAPIVIDFDVQADLDNFGDNAGSLTEPIWDATNGVGGSGAVKPAGSAGTAAAVMTYPDLLVDLTQAGETFEASLDFIFTMDDLQTGTIDPVVRLGFGRNVGDGVNTGLFVDVETTGTTSTGLTVQISARNDDGETTDNVLGTATLEADTWYTFRATFSVDSFTSATDNQFTLTGSIDGIASSAATGIVYDKNVDTTNHWAFRADKVSNNHYLDNFTIVPEPASLALLGLGGLAMLRRS